MLSRAFSAAKTPPDKHDNPVTISSSPNHSWLYKNHSSCSSSLSLSLSPVGESSILRRSSKEEEDRGIKGVKPKSSVCLRTPSQESSHRIVTGFASPNKEEGYEEKEEEEVQQRTEALLSKLGVTRSTISNNIHEVDREIYEELESLARRASRMEVTLRRRSCSSISDGDGDEKIITDYARETLRTHVPVADRLGVWCLKSRLEDLAFQHLHPLVYLAVKKEAEERRDREAVLGTVRRVQDVLLEYDVPIHDLTGRSKNLYGIWKKSGEHVCPVTAAAAVEEVLDVSAVRVIVDTRHDCYRAMRAVQESFPCVPSRFKDYIKGEKKENGYRSLHDTVYMRNNSPVEIQVRTPKMHYIAEYGPAAHWAYKERQEHERQSDLSSFTNETYNIAYRKWRTSFVVKIRDTEKVRLDHDDYDASLSSLRLTESNVATLDDRDRQCCFYYSPWNLVCHNMNKNIEVPI